MFVIETEIQREICGVDVYAALLKTDGKDMAHRNKNEWGCVGLPTGGVFLETL